MEKGKKNKSKIIWKAIKKKVTPQYLILLILLLVSNSFAWFIYSTQVNSDVSVHVKAWKVEFKNADTPINQYVNVNITNAYPGMTAFSQTITAYNESEVQAGLSYTIMSVNLMGTQIKTVEGVNADGGTLTGSEPTSAQLATQLASNYPFKITITMTADPLASETGTGSFVIGMTWAYESGDDVADTNWGTQAYTYKQANPTSPSIAMVIKISITQQN